jgi:hypothetical protein
MPNLNPNSLAIPLALIMLGMIGLVALITAGLVLR